MPHIRTHEKHIQNDEAVNQRWLRITTAVAAYAYEFENIQIMSDAEFDCRCKMIDSSISTIEFRHHADLEVCQRYMALDDFYRKKFSPSTGMWIYDHPELNRVKALFQLTVGSWRGI